MDNAKKFVILVVVVTGFAIFHSSDAYKTEEQMIAEIRSMASAITEQCISDPLVDNCTQYEDALNETTILSEACLLLGAFSQCESNVCQDHSQALNQILMDAMIIPYCTTLSKFPLEKDYWGVLERLSAMGRMCQFKPNMGCDLELGNFLVSRVLDLMCLNERYYVLCLEQSCVNQSLELLQKIGEAKNDSLCGYYELPLSFSATKGAPYNDISKGPVPIPYDNKTSVIITSATSATVQGADTTVGVEAAKLKEILSLNDAMGRYCVIGSYFTGCSDEKRKVQDHVTLQDACGDEKSYIACMENKCKSPSSVLRDQIYQAKTLCGTCNLLRVSLLAILTSLLAIYL